MIRHRYDIFVLVASQIAAEFERLRDFLPLTKYYTQRQKVVLKFLFGNSQRRTDTTKRGCPRWNSWMSTRNPALARQRFSHPRATSFVYLGSSAASHSRHGSSHNDRHPRPPPRPPQRSHSRPRRRGRWRDPSPPPRKNRGTHAESHYIGKGKPGSPRGVGKTE